MASNRFHTGQIITAAGFVGPVTGDVTGNVKGNVTGNVAPTVQAVIPTATGATTGTILPSTTFATVASTNADHIVILPAPVPGKEIILYGNATGYELRSSAPATISINGGAEANAESAIAASLMLRCVCVSATAWIVNSYAAAGTEAAVAAAAA